MYVRYFPTTKLTAFKLAICLVVGGSGLLKKRKEKKGEKERKKGKGRRKKGRKKVSRNFSRIKLKRRTPYINRTKL